MQCPSGLFDAEKQLFAQSGLLWNAFLELPIEHPCDRQEFMATLHSLQRMILMRPARRALCAEYPA